MKIKIFVFGLLAALAFQSCVSYDELVNLNDEGVTTKKANSYRPYSLKSYEVRPFDNLMIRVNNFEENTISYFNDEYGSRGANINEAQLYLSSYVVNERGEIELPLIGTQKVSGLSLTEIKDTLDRKLSPYLRFASTSVKLSNFRVTVLGEVANPGLINLYNEKTTLLQAIGAAGGMNTFANRKKVKLVREYDSGTETKYYDLTNGEFLASDEYFLLPNDVIYVEPLKSRAGNVNLQSFSVVISAVSLIAVVANIIISNSGSN